ncbi:MAG: amino acid adenylation domain-containing protein, partial [Acidobacteriota bacterium]
SGSTGLPKGVMVTHGGVCNMIATLREVFAVKPASRVTQLASFSFDASILEILLALPIGATLLLTTREVSLSGPPLIQLLREQEVTVAFFPPSMLAALPVTTLPKLETIIVGGEACSAELVDRWANNRRFFNAYGPTEATVLTTVAECHNGNGKPSIGRPILNTQVYLLDQYLQPVPIGVPGELHIGGVSLSRGYRQRPELTAEKYIPNPFSNQPGTRLYKTGDRARYLPNGEIEFLGRIDRQVKIRGFRIETEEIEAVLSRHKSVRESAIVAREDVNGDKRLVAYIVPQTEEIPTTNELRSFLQQYLPDYLLPANFVILTSLPLMPNGKVDLRALTKLDILPNLQKEFIPPRTELETLLTNILREILAVEKIGVYDNFFELGGDSIKAAILANRLQEQLGEIVHVVAVFDASTVADLARYLNEHYPAAIAKNFSSITSYSVEGYKQSNTGIRLIDSATVTQMRQLITPLPPRKHAVKVKNRQAIFILSAPRSGSTLFRVMLGGHPLLFAPPELEILSFNTLKERKHAFTGRDNFWLEGAIRAVMELKNCNAEMASEIIEDCERRDLTTQEFYQLLQEWLGERRLVDKTPAYALDLTTLKRAEEDFDNALYIHLQRHPGGMIRSFEQARLDQILSRYKHPFSTREFAELVWIISQENIREFLSTIPASRQHYVKFEDLVSKPEATLQAVCQFLDIDFHPDLLEPYKNREKRMTDGIHTVSRMLGDVKFHQHTKIDASVANQWQEDSSIVPLGETTWKVARLLGYQLEQTAIIPIQPINKDQHTNLPLSFAQQRLWFLAQLESDSFFYNCTGAVRLTGSLDISVLRKSLSEIVRRHKALRTIFPMLDGCPTQAVLPAHPLLLPVIDLAELPKSQYDLAVSLLLNTEAQRPFDLAQELLLRVGLIRLTEVEHVLFLAMHHIVSDGWSIGIFLRELAILYKAFINNQPSPLPELSIQYTDFAYWQREWMQGEVLHNQLSYWKKQLAGAPHSLNLFTDRPRPAIQTYLGAHQQLTLSKDLLDRLNGLSLKQGTTLFMTLLAAFKVLLYRYTDQLDIVVGSPIANRNRPEIEPLIGFFVNTLVLRTKLVASENFEQLLARVRQMTLEAYIHQDVPFEKLVEELQPVRDLSRSPLFQVMFVLQNAPTTPLELKDLTLNFINIENQAAKFDLTITLAETSQGLVTRLDYNTDLFEAYTIKRILSHWQILLESITKNSQQYITALQILTVKEQEQLLVNWNNTSIDYRQDHCIHQLFEEQTARTPASIAVVFEGEQLSYQELNQRANQLAHYLIGLGVGPEVLVGICLDRCIEMIVAIMAVLKAGGAYLPIDPSYPLERIAFMLENAGVTLILTEKQRVDELSKNLVQIVCLDNEWNVISSHSDINPITNVNPNNLAYVIYTSGSTGKPKGVMIAHHSVVNYLTWCCQTYPIQSGQAIPLHSSLSFDLTVTSLLLPLVVGQQIIVVTAEEGLAGLKGVLSKQRNLSLVKLTPAHLDMLNQQLLATEMIDATRALVIGGEALLAESLTYWRKYSPQTDIFNEYGPTEATVGCSVYQVMAEDDSSGVVSIGRPIANTQLYILDKYHQAVPIGVIGELYIGGTGLARGYLNRPDLTAERFIPNPYSGESGARLYRTGDLVRYLADGNIAYLGRIDNQVKVRGYRIELAEIESVLSSHNRVSECVVIAREDRDNCKQLVAYLVAKQEEVITVNELRAYLKTKLPEYMLPSTYVVLDKLPLTANGKLDRRVLPEPDQTRPELESLFILPRTAKEELLARIWSQVLGIKQIGAYDNFFELGGDSILSIQIVAKANQAGLKITPKQLFQYQTIAELAMVAETASVITAVQDVIIGDVPLTPIQKRFFRENLIEPDHFNQSVLLITQQLDIPLLLIVIKRLLTHHDALRLRFTPSTSGWQQINTDIDNNIPFTKLDLSILSKPQQQQAIEVTAKQLQGSLNLSNGPVLRIACFDLGTKESGRLLIIIHHLVIDLVSWRILLEDLQTAYQQLSNGKAIQLPAKTTAFKHWAEQLSEYAQLETTEQELNYWLAKQYNGITSLPVDYRDGVNNQVSTDSVLVSLSVIETSALLQQVHQAYHTQINDLLLTAMVEAFSQWTGRRVLLVDLEGHGREDIIANVDLSRTVGWFTTVFPVLLDLEQVSDIVEGLKSIKEQLRQIPQHGIGYGVLKYLGRPEVVKRLKELPYPQVSFNYLGQFDQVLSESYLFVPAQEERGPSQSLQAIRSHLLNINGSIVSGQLQLSCIYSKNIYKHETIARLMANFAEVLRSLILHCQSITADGYTPSDFPLVKLSQQRLDQLLRTHRQIEDIYTLSPIQQGMLFHSLYDPSAGIYFQHLSCQISGELNIYAFEQAWQKLIERHSIFRTSFHWNQLEEPIQIVHHQAQLTLLQQDWRELSTTIQQERLIAYLKADRELGFDFSQAPLMRVALIQLTESSYQLIWSYHHLLIDGWSLPLVFKEFLIIYNTYCQGK